jgi:Ca2+-transporting ATPase
MKPFTKKANELLSELNSDVQKGLTKEQVIKQKETYGTNQLIEKKGETLISMILGELLGFLNILLLIAAIVSIFASKDLTDGVFIIVIVILNTALSVFQEKKANNAVAALKSISAPHAKVLRDGVWTQIESQQVVVGDIIQLDAGDYVPADIRLIESVNLKINESALTGESIAVDKNANVVLKEDSSIGDCLNMAFMSTVVTYGRGIGVVCAVGMSSEIGKIAQLLNDVKDDLTPLQIKISKLGKMLGSISVVVVVLIFLIGLLYNFLKIAVFDVVELFLVSVSLAVAAIPEGLPTVITIVLSLGMRKMADKKAIVKKISAVETLGSTTVIASDKTGTLTQNKMVVTRVFDNHKVIEVTGKGYEFKGEIKGGNSNIELLTTIGLLCNDSVITKQDLIGDPTELALVSLAAKNNQPQELRDKYPRINELPFDSERKRMSTTHKVGNKVYAYVKGAPDQILKVCKYYLLDGEVKPLDQTFEQVVSLANQGMAHNALRVLGFAYKELSENATQNNIEEDLIFVGLVGIIDPPRQEVKEAISICHTAGIRVVMITGDHKITASAIGKELGIINTDHQALSGDEIDSLTDQEFFEKVKTTNVFARVSPTHKVKIVKALQRHGEICAMTGDGVNDAPALKQANIGVAMGVTGTDVSKEAADMVLMDDNFTTIVEAVEEGRVIYSNIRKFVAYLISCNVGEVLLIFVAMLLGWGSPLLPIQILWINLVTDSFPAFALGLEQKEQGIMNRKPISPDSEIVDKQMAITVAFQAVFLTIAVLISYYVGARVINTHVNLGYTFAFITIITGELLRTYSARSENSTLFQMRLFTNKWVNLSTLFGFSLLFIVLYVPGINDLFRTNVHLTFLELLLALGLGFIPLFGGELSKLFK